MKAAVIASLLVVSSPQSLSAQQPTKAPKAIWTVDWTEHYCVLTREPLPGEAARFSLRFVPGSLDPELIVVLNQPRNSLKANKNKPFTIQLEPAGFRTEVEDRNVKGQKTQAIFAFAHLTKEFVDQFPAAEEISLIQRGRLVSRMPLIGTAKAFGALQECRDKKLSEIGFDPKAMQKLRSWPDLMDWDKWIPIVWKQETEASSSVFRVTVTSGGRAINCTVIDSSEKERARNACLVIENIGRFEPAIADDGSPVAAPYVFTLTRTTGVITAM